MEGEGGKTSVTERDLGEGGDWHASPLQRAPMYPSM